MDPAIYLIYAVAFLDLLAVSLIIPLIPNQTRLMGANQIQIGLLGSIYACFQFMSGPVMGSLSDIKGRKGILIICLLVCSIAYLCIGNTSSIVIILLMRAVLGIMKHTQMLSKALIPDFVPIKEDQSIIYGNLAAVSGAGMSLGPTVGGHLMEMYPDNGFTLISYIVGFCLVLNTCIVYCLPQTYKSSNAKNNSESIGVTLKQPFEELYKVPWSTYRTIFILKAFLGLAMGVYYTNYSLYLKVQYDLTPKHIGYVISIQGLIGVVSSSFIRFINKFYKGDSDFSQRNLHVFLCITLSLLGLIMSFNVYCYVVWLIPLAVGNALGRLFTLESILVKCDKKHRGTLIGASNSVRSLTGIVSPLLSGFIGHYLGVKYVMYASFMATLAGTFLVYQIRRDSKIKKKTE